MNFSYFSTRDPSKTLFSFEEAVMMGLCDDKGLFVTNLQRFDSSDIVKVRYKSFLCIAYIV